MSLRRFMHRKEKDADLKQEIESHLAHEQDSNQARGLSPDEAQRQARLKFGNPESTRDQVWRQNSLPWVENIWRDLRFAVRSLMKMPGFTAIAVLVIAVGMVQIRQFSPSSIQFCLNRSHIPSRNRWCS